MSRWPKTNSVRPLDNMKTYGKFEFDWGNDNMKTNFKFEVDLGNGSKYFAFTIIYYCKQVIYFKGFMVGILIGETVLKIPRSFE